MIDPSTEAGKRADERLRGELVIWLTTVDGSGRPQTSPVWFLWDGEAFLLRSMPASRKVPNIRGNPKVSLNLNGDRHGGDIVTIEGVAEIVDAAPDHLDSAHLRKYEREIARIGYDTEGFARAYSTTIVVRPSRARVW